MQQITGAVSWRVGGVVSRGDTIKPFLYIVFLVSFASSAQNLVPNGSFEEYSECPEEREYNNGQFERCKGWWYPTNYNIGTPDYYNVCNNFIGGSTQGMVGVPDNSRGFQFPIDGDAYLGFAALSIFNQENQYEGMEPISCKLSEPLSACIEYKFSCYLNLANISTHGLDHFGIVITNDSLSLNTFEEIYTLTPIWDIDISDVDTLGWTLLEGAFLPKGGELYLTLGFFHTFENTNWKENDTVTLGFDGKFAYYYIDSVSLIELEDVEYCEPNLPNFFTPNGDYTNDEYSTEGLNISEMVIFNRWGNVVATLNENYPTWDGTFEGEPCSEGSYFYRAKFGTTYLTGFIELIR